jgi:small GTP-binding protein
MSKVESEPINTTPIPCKIIFLGESGVGKTSIISRYMQNYQSAPENTLAATSFNKIIRIDDLEVELQIWDTAGQEQYRSITSLFYKEAMICILVYDITKKSSFVQIKEYWYNSVKENGMKDAIIAIVGNKCDLFEEEEVSQDEGKHFCESINAIFKVVSAKEGIGIDKLFNEIIEKFKVSQFMDQLIYKYLSKNQRKTLNSKRLKLEKDDNNSKNSKKKKCC